MPVSSTVGDLSRALTLRLASGRTKERMTILSRELSTGRRADLPAGLGGDTRQLASVEHRLQILEISRRNSAEIGGRLEASQTAMEALHDIASGLGTSLLATAMANNSQAIETALVGARGNFDAAVGLLNTSFGGEYIFAGARTTTRPLARPDEIINAVTTAVSGLTDLDDVIAAVGLFFDAAAGAGGFVDLNYAGSASGWGPVAVAPDRSVGSDITAAAPEFRDLLKGLALAALVAEGVVSADPSSSLRALQSAGNTVLGADDRVTHLRARQGVVQETVELARTRNESEMSALQIARNELIRVDEYETATALSEAQTLLETLYTVTARLSQLSLARRL